VFNPATPLPGIYPRELKMYIHRNTCTQVFIATFSKSAKTGKKKKDPSAVE